jgi:hypothetical protein
MPVIKEFSKEDNTLYPGAVGEFYAGYGILLDKNPGKPLIFWTYRGKGLLLPLRFPAMKDDFIGII